MIKLKKILSEAFKTLRLNRNFNPNDLDKSSFKLMMKKDDRGGGGVIIGKIWHNKKDYLKQYGEFILRGNYGEENGTHYSLWVGGRAVYQFGSLKDVNSILGLNLKSSIDKQIIKMISGD